MVGAIPKGGTHKVLLFSSGLDSYIGWHYLGNPKCVHITGHSRYSERELRAVKELVSYDIQLNIQIVYIGEWLQKFEQEDANIPGRNALFAMVAAHFGEKIYLPCQLGEQEIPDRSPKFFADTSIMLSTLFERETTVDPVFPDMTKQDMVAWYLSRGKDPEMLYRTYSCFAGQPWRCGECAACFRTAVALDYNRILPDEKFFNRNIWEWRGIPGYIERIEAGHYHPRRAIQTLEVLKKHDL